MQGKYTLPSVPLTQQAFFFVDTDARQQMDELYESQRLKQERRFIHNTETNAPVVRVEVLNQPIFTRQGREALEEYSIDPIDTPVELLDEVEDDAIAASEQEKEEIKEWFADRPEQFIGYVIDQAIESLASVGNAKEKKHQIEWIFAGNLYGHEIITVDGKDVTRPVFSRDVPMTFQWCCRVYGLNAERFQEKLLSALKHAESETRIREERGELKAGRHNVFRDARVLAENL